MRIRSDLIRLEMAKKNLKIKDIADRTGISSQSISTILNRQTCYPANAGKIARALEIDEDAIIASGVE